MGQVPAENLWATLWRSSKKGQYPKGSQKNRPINHSYLELGAETRPPQTGLNSKKDDSVQKFSIDGQHTRTQEAW